jgi:hypothetical protein
VPSCTPCPAGRFSTVIARSDSLCPSPCPAGSMCPAGSSAPILCPAGSYSLASAGACTVCPPSAPYSPVGSVSSAACTSCTARCEAGLHGVYACPAVSTTDEWLVWLDVAGVEGNHSCLRYNSSGTTFVAAAAACGAHTPGAHLLTSVQVGGCRIHLFFLMVWGEGDCDARVFTRRSSWTLLGASLHTHAHKRKAFHALTDAVGAIGCTPCTCTHTM